MISPNIFNYINSLIKNKKKGFPYPGSFPGLIRVFSLAGAKRVNKPWGFEIWIADGTTEPYAFKIIGLKAGTQTSLQYHRKKLEHNFILSGVVRLHYENKDTKKIQATKELTAGNVVLVKPPAIHRVEAITDAVLIETSTPQLDDVIRVSDDYNRGDGKISSEHDQK